jgi:hypothetical protein
MAACFVSVLLINTGCACLHDLSSNHADMHRSVSPPAGMTQLVGCIAVSDDHAWRHSSVGVAGAGAAVARLLRLHV